MSPQTDPDRPRRLLWIDPSFGASGDMILGALFALGAEVETVRADLETLPIDGWTIEVTPTIRASISATFARVITGPHPGGANGAPGTAGSPDAAGSPGNDRTPGGDGAPHYHGGHQHHHHSRTWAEIDQMLANADMAADTKASARRTFALLAEAEAEVHGVTPAEVHFHEVGAVDSIVDTVGAWSALHQLAIDEVVVGPVGVGHGHVDTQHGRLPLPAPAAALLLRDCPVDPVDYRGETVTPTGAALLASMADRWGSMPPGTLRAMGRGAGGRNPLTHPNVVTAYLLDQPRPQSGADGQSQPHPQHDEPAPLEQTAAFVLATNIDDATPEVLAHTIARLLEAGADDAWLVPIVMKKGRPAHELRVLCSLTPVDQLLPVVMAETGSLGVRVEPVTKHMAPRHTVTVVVDDQPIRVKIGPYGAKPEHDDLAAAARELQTPIRLLANRVISQLPGN